MSAFLEGMSKSFCIWPKTDYNKFIPKSSPSTEAWSNVGKLLANSILNYDRTLKEKEFDEETLMNARNACFIDYFHEKLDSSDINSTNKEYLFNILISCKNDKEQDSLLNEIYELKLQLQKLEQKLQTSKEESQDNNE